MIAALRVNDKIVTGCNHGDAFNKLDDDDKDSDIQSGFINPETLEFILDYNFELRVS